VGHPPIRTQGLDAKKSKTSLWREKCFYLTSPFIEPAKAAAHSFQAYREEVINCGAIRNLVGGDNN
jgi:hypothetical protein